MLRQQTLDKMNAMKLSGMAEAFRQQLGAGEYARLSFEERFGLLIDSDWISREQRKLLSCTIPCGERERVLGYLRPMHEYDHDRV